MSYNKDIDWADIHLRYINGETEYSIAKSLKGQVTKQAIMYRRKKQDWVRADQGPDKFPVKIGKEVVEFEDERKARIIGALGQGHSYKVAAGVAGISDDTLGRWRKNDPDFAAVVLRAKAKHLGDHETVIDKAGKRGDWKASAYLLERDPITKGQYQQRQEGVQTAIQINVGIDRNEVKIR